jgi:hypothetical protein
VVGARDQLGKVVDTLPSAVKAGELDHRPGGKLGTPRRAKQPV